MPIPLVAFTYTVQAGDDEFSCTEVTGLNIEAQVIEYRPGNSPRYSTISMPGLLKYGNITLKRAVMKSDNGLYDWFNATKLNKPERRDIIISLLDEEREPVMTWSVTGAWVTKITSPDLGADKNEVAFESIDLAHNGYTIENP